MIAQLNHFTIQGYAQGTTYSISYYHQQAIISKKAIDSLLQDIDHSLSSYQAHSLISKFNHPDVNEMEVDNYLNDVLNYSFKVNKAYKGIFDLTVSPLVSLWGFGPQKHQQPPDSLLLSQTLQKVGMNKLKFKNRMLKKRIHGVSIDVNGIAQGYSVDVLARFLKRNEVNDFMVEIGGEIITSGLKPNNEKFKIAIQRVYQTNEAKDYIVSLTDKAITTSGNYEQYREYKGKRISHHIDPKTGYPVTGNIISATVIADSAMEADALDNVFITMHPDEAIRIANTKKKIDIYLIYEENGIIKEAYSNGFLKYIN